ncbi:divergent protein kinase domain 1C-like [Uloborus diversus]|uniref:divergent protein kinase domain 1C-like n=1 Tax=Uloborus diversus TaxID=327109 RepID=UPI00240A8540|nr:divergent protein kinase domain 1C-like [Uloborus diversus]
MTLADTVVLLGIPFLHYLWLKCDKYQNREALGNMCADLCELNTLKPNNCLPNHVGKDVVFEAIYFNDQVVVKSSKQNYDDFDQVFYVDSEGNKVHPNIDIFYSMISNTIQTNLGITLKPTSNESLNLLTKLWTRNMLNFPHLPVSIQNIAMSNIWFLVQQSEYLLMKYFEEVNIFPKVLGTCGFFYIVEFIQPLNNYFEIFYPSWQENFTKRASFALKIIKFLEDTEKYFPLLHFCDIKVGHFGLDKTDNIKLLDMDMVFFEPSLIQNMVSTESCSNNKDCSFLDCKGLCNVTSQKCEAKVLDNNFQRVCENVFAGKLMPSYFGLLSSPPKTVSRELHILLQRCSDTLDMKVISMINNELKFLLTSVVK